MAILGASCGPGPRSLTMPPNSLPAPAPASPALPTAFSHLECRLLVHVEQQQPRHERHALAVPHLHSAVQRSAAQPMLGEGGYRCARQLPLCEAATAARACTCTRISILSPATAAQHACVPSSCSSAQPPAPSPAPRGPAYHDRWPPAHNRWLAAHSCWLPGNPYSSPHLDVVQRVGLEHAEERLLALLKAKERVLREGAVDVARDDLIHLLLPHAARAARRSVRSAAG